MTVITTLITQVCTVHATDSFITTANKDGTAEVKESDETKIVRVQTYHGAMSYWGLATYDYYQWSTLEWLRQQAREANLPKSAEDFARRMTERLNNELSRMTFNNPLDKGIGIHFSAYEEIDGQSIPELFALTNYSSTDYNSLHVDGIHWGRQTYCTIYNSSRPREEWIDPKPEHRDSAFRRQVQSELNRGGWLRYNNGDPVMFNPVANAILESISTIAQRNALRDTNAITTYLSLAELSVDMVCRIQERLVQSERIFDKIRMKPFLKGKRRIGGKRHVLGITPNGAYKSTSRD